MTRKLILFLLINMTLAGLSGQTPADLTSYRWTMINAEGEVKGRHENGFVEYNGKFYLIGGRGINPVNVFDPVTNRWETRANSPIQIHHFQPVVYGNAIYLVGAMTGGYPTEAPLENIWIYYPDTDKWEKGSEIPEARRRGGAGVAIHDDKIYIVCGIEYGHTSGTNNYFDSYDLKTGEWKILTKAPHIRDHFPAIVVNDRLYVIGGRNGSVHYEDNFGAFFEATVPEVDYYDFKQKKWFTMKEKLPVPTAAGGIVNTGNCIIYMGGEGRQQQAYNQTQCLDLATGSWSQLSPLVIGRHGSGAIFFNGRIYIAAGSPNKGGGNMTSIEVFSSDHNWEIIFNGMDLTGWSVKCSDEDKGKNYWFVEDGSIVCDTRGNNINGHMWLQSDREYDNFELRLKYQPARVHRGNSGVQVRSRWDPMAKVDVHYDGWLDGPQVDIDPNNPWRNGLIYDETRTNRRWINPSLPDAGIKKDNYTPNRVIQYFDDQEPGWNDLLIICDGMNIRTFVNNQMISDYDGTGVIDDESHLKHNVGTVGHIALQLHKNSSNLIRFKDIEIRKLR